MQHNLISPNLFLSHKQQDPPAAIEVLAHESVTCFLSSYYPIVHTLIHGTVMARAASSMSLPFLAIYLARHTSMSAVMIGVVIGMGTLPGIVCGFVGGFQMV
jgi:hypothetical protein